MIKNILVMIMLCLITFSIVVDKSVIIEDDFIEFTLEEEKEEKSKEEIEKLDSEKEINEFLFSIDVNDQYIDSLVSQYVFIEIGIVLDPANPPPESV